MSQKHTGSYYTPDRLADYIVYRLFGENDRGYKFDMTPLDVLEPSVGGGMFLDSLMNGNHYSTKHPFNIPLLKIDATEINPKVAAKTKLRVKSYEKSKGTVNVINEDYLKYFLRKTKKYDLIIGNPPYVRRRNMKPEQRELCSEVHKKTGLHDTNPKNLWTSFFAGAKESLKAKGVIAFVLPTDLIQVKYPEEIRTILHEEFDRVEIFSFNWLAFKKFDDIEQDVVILICSNGHGQRRGIDFYRIDSENDLEKPKITQDHDNSRRDTLNKWTNYVLDEHEFRFLDNIHQKINPETIRYYCDSGAGIVTAANDYYIVDEATMDKYLLRDLHKKTIKKTSSMFPALTLTDEDLNKKAKEGAQLFFLDFPNQPKSQLPKKYLRYLQIGEEQNIHNRYKMLLRDNWYSVPSVSRSEAFFTKRSNKYPRIIVNEANAYVTDAFYRIRMKQGFSEKNLSLSFFNTFTFIYSELMGRFYGGGVLELTPNEFKGLPVPYIKGAVNQKLKKLDKLVRSGASHSELLNYADSVILEKQFGISKQDVKKLREIYRKLLVRRLKKEQVDI